MYLIHVKEFSSFTVGLPLGTSAPQPQLIFLINSVSGLIWFNYTIKLMQVVVTVTYIGLIKLPRNFTRCLIHISCDLQIYLISLILLCFCPNHYLIISKNQFVFFTWCMLIFKVKKNQKDKLDKTPAFCFVRYTVSNKSVDIFLIFELSSP